MTKRDAILKLRESIRERGSDSTYSNKYLYTILEIHSKWLIKREESAKRIYKSDTLFKKLKCFPVMEVSSIDDECSVKTNCKVFRTVDKVPECWEDTDGYIIKDVASLDGSHTFKRSTFTSWRDKQNNPYSKFLGGTITYFFFLDGYLYFTDKAPREIIIIGYFKDDVSHLGNCCKPKECSKFLDGEFNIPEWIEGELFAQATQELAGITKRMLEDEQPDSNTLRKGQN
jgi:hypothetical protein